MKQNHSNESTTETHARFTPFCSRFKINRMCKLCALPSHQLLGLILKKILEVKVSTVLISIVVCL